jgi:enhancer of polycomb-like protein
MTNLKQPQKRKPDNSQSQRPYTGPLRFPGRPERPLEADLILLSDLMGRKEIALQQEIEEKTKQHRKWNASYVDLTREPLSPVQGQGPEAGFRPATTQYQYLMTPPSSVTSESFDQSSPTQEKSDPFTFRYSSPPEEDDSYGQPAYRRRIGRCGRLWIDRRGMPSIPRCVEGINLDRWKYDQDDDNEQPVYEVDPYDTKALRFRATIPIPSHQPPQRNRPDDRLVPLRVSGISPTNSRIITTQTQPQLPT